MNTRRLLLYLGLNAIVSAAVTLTVLVLWERLRPAPARPNPVALQTQSVASPTAKATTRADTPAPVFPTPTLYTVQSGDTLGSIAEQFDVSVEDLLAANGLVDPNVLDVGQTLLIPVPGGPVVTSESATSAALPTHAAATLPPTPTHDPNVPLPRLVIREVQSAGSLNQETVVILNEGGPVDLAGWTLRDEAGHLYIFPALTLFQDGAVNIHTASGQDTVTDLYWGQSESVWASGKTALLSDASGNLHARLTVP